MYLGAKIIAAGGKVASIDELMIAKDVTIKEKKGIAIWIFLQIRIKQSIKSMAVLIRLEESPVKQYCLMWIITNRV